MASLGYSSEDRFQPSAKLLNRTAAAGFSYLTPAQQAPVSRCLSHGSGAGNYNSLPRQRPNTGGPTSLSSARRKIVNSALQDYLKSLNSMTRSIVLETETVEKDHKYNWTKLDVAKKEDLVNDHFMPSDVRLQYDSQRAASCCDFSPSNASQDLSIYRDDAVRQSSNLERSRHTDQTLRTSGDLVYRNEWSSTATQREDFSLSQPSIPNCYQEPAAEKTNFNRLHKQQLSFRPNHKHAVKPLPAQSSFRSQIGSDGESPRTSDEDFEGLGGQNSLGFQRSKLRSYSMRSKKGNGGIRNSANLRSSVRTSNRIKTNPDGDESTPHNHDESYPQLCRPSHSHTYSTTSNETDFDEAIDLPDDALMLDHVSRKSSTEDSMFNDEYQSKKAPRYTRTRRSLRGMPKITLEQSEVHVNRSFCSEATQSSSSFASSDAYLEPDSSREGAEMYRPPSRDSLDFDSVSMAPSDASKYPMDDEEDLCRMTPDSVLSLSSGYSCRPRSKNSELAVLRNRRGNRGGSQIKVATSNFADRHTQFKNNMSPSYPTSACTTRATSPTSPASTVSWPTHEQDRTGHLKAPSFSYGTSKHNSMAESTASDFPCSPDHSSILSSPPNTPLAGNYASNTHMLRSTLSHYEDRESGYISSSLESFPVAIRR